jgi:hypothetical protein
MCKHHTEHFFHECGHTGISRTRKENCDCPKIEFGMRFHDGEFCPECRKSNLIKNPLLEDATQNAEVIEQKICALMKIRRKWRLRERQFYSSKGDCCGACDCINGLTPESYKYWPDNTYTNMKSIPADEISDGKCGICWGFYKRSDDGLCESKGERLMLPCGHIFGRTCIEHTLYQRGKNSLGNNCPLCTVAFFPQHVLPSPYSSLGEIFDSEKPTGRVIRSMWYLVYFLSMPWAMAVMFIMDSGPKCTALLEWPWNILAGFTILLLLLITYLVTISILLAGVLYGLFLDAQELIFGPPQGRYIPLQTVTEYMLELEKNAQLLDNAVE